MSEFPPLIYVDLVEVERLSFVDWSVKYGSSQGVFDRQHSYGAYGSKFQPWRWVAKSGDNQKVLARSSERYYNRSDCLHAINLLFGDGSNVYVREHEVGNQVLRLARSEL